MTNKTLRLAKEIDEKLNHLYVKRTACEQTEKRDNDEDFNFILKLAHDEICNAISRLKQDFDLL